MFYFIYIKENVIVFKEFNAIKYVVSTDNSSSISIIHQEYNY